MSTEQTAEATATAIKEGLAEIENGMKKLNSSSMSYTMSCMVNAQQLLLTKYATFKVGDRVQLTKAPVINAAVASGWMGARHFLIPGAVATIQTVKVPQEGDLYYGLVFDEESYLDSKDRPVLADRKHQFCFAIDYLEVASECLVKDTTDAVLATMFKGPFLELIRDHLEKGAA